MKINLRIWIILIIFLILSVMVRVDRDYEGTFDSYRNHALSGSISEHGYAKWVLHPASLIGYYPLSEPSGLMFLFSVTQMLTGLQMHMLIRIMSPIIALICIFFLYTLIRKTGSPMFALTAVTVYSFSPYFAGFTNNNLSGRIFLLMFYPLIIWLLFHLIGSERKWRYSGLICLFVLLSMLFHRTSQLLIPVLVAFAAAYLVFHFKELRTAFLQIDYFRSGVQYIRSIYRRKPKRVVRDISIAIGLLTLIKFTDLLIRGRLLINFQRRVLEPLTELSGNSIKILIIVLTLTVLASIVYLYFRNTKVKEIINIIVLRLRKHIDANPSFWLSISLFAVFIYLFVGQFFGKSMYDPSLSEYYTTELLSGRGPLIVFANYILNLMTSVSIFTPFTLVGLIYIFFKRNKSFFDYYLLFFLLAFSSILMDKRYVRLFTIPIFSVVSAIGFMMVWRTFLHKLRSGMVKGIVVLGIFTILLVGTHIPTLRDQIIKENTFDVGIDHYKAAGYTLKSFDCDCSTVTTKELKAAMIIFAFSGIPGASHNIYYYVDQSYLRPERVTFNEVWERFKRGDKIRSLWELDDWILGGQYYTGRHALLVFDNDLYDPRVQRVISDYNEKYYIHVIHRDRTPFLDSITDIRNLIYANPKITIYDLTKGR